MRLHGGISGPGSVAGYNLGNNAGAAAEQVAALTPLDGRAAFKAVGDADIPPLSSFVEDGLAPDPGSFWFRFDPQIGTLAADPRMAWKVRESSGRGHALFPVVALRMEAQRPLGLDIEFRRQDPGATLGPAALASVDLTRGPAYVGFEGAEHPEAASGDWDVAISPEFAVLVNGECGAGTFPLDATEDFTTETRADDAPEYADFLAAVSGSFPAGVSDADGVFWYGIQDSNRMWPTYNVFLVAVEQEVYKVQVHDYYSATGASGFPSLRGSGGSDETVPRRVASRGPRSPGRPVRLPPAGPGAGRGPGTALGQRTRPGVGRGRRRGRRDLDADRRVRRPSGREAGR